MFANYHTHTWRCGHAEKNEEGYIQTAYDAGIRILGFSDHIPHPFYLLDKDYISPPRMTCDMLPDYMDTLTALKEKYKDKMSIHIGFEAEYYPDLFPHLMEMLKPYPCEYLILGQHFVGNEIGEAYCGIPTDAPSRLHAYVEQCKAAMDTGVFTYLAHPDLLLLRGNEQVYRQYARELCRAAKEQNMPIEFNLLGFITGRHYPTPAFWEEASVVGNQVILGWDAHQVNWMNQPRSEADALAYLSQLGIHPICQLSLVNPFFNR